MKRIVARNLIRARDSRRQFGLKRYLEVRFYRGTLFLSVFHNVEWCDKFFSFLLPAAAAVNPPSRCCCCFFPPPKRPIRDAHGHKTAAAGVIMKR